MIPTDSEAKETIEEINCGFILNVDLIGRREMKVD